MSSRSRKSSRAKSSSANTSIDASLQNDDTVAIGSRRSARSNKFSCSMKEPTESSVVSLLRISDNVSTKHKIAGTPQQNKRTKRNIKSPAVRHSRARRQMKIESVESESDSEDEDDEEEEEEDSNMSSEEEGEDSDEEEEEEEELKIQRIIAVRSESKRKWKEICKNVNTSEVENGSRWFQQGKLQETDEQTDQDEDMDDSFEERFLVKWADLSFLHCSWETQDDMIEQVEGAKTYLTTFFRKSVNGFLYDGDDRLDGDYFDPGFVQIDRILEINLPDSLLESTGKKKNSRSLKSNKKEDWGIVFDKSHPDYESELGRQFLIKWGNSPYADATFEYERDLIMMEVEYQSHTEDYLERSIKPPKRNVNRAFQAEEEERRRLYKVFGDRVADGEQKEDKIKSFRRKLEDMEFKNGGKLRDYQAEGVSWLMANHINKRSAILADEMGLGKTIQTAAYIYMVQKQLHCRGPFLIVAPLSTIPHWQREFSGWTDMNTIVYHGSAKDREVIREYEFAYDCDRPQGGIGINQRFLKKCHRPSSSRAEKIWMTQVVITTPEMLVTDDFTELKAVKWEAMVVDEAHRLKNVNSKLALNLRSDGFNFRHCVLLTGTPIQNNMNELWTLMNFIDDVKFDSCDNFMELYGNMTSKEAVDGLHNVIRPYILRRLKEDVEKSVPPKEETLVEVELTVVQKQYYRALYEKNVQFLHRDVKKALDGPSLNNLAMQLRKCCNHPFLLNGVEETLKKGTTIETVEDEAEFLTKSSGKLVLLDKLLPRLKEGGHRVLIFSQFKIMLDILEDYLSLRSFKFERIDGSITGKKRQMAIDRFQNKSDIDSSFIMLLSTRAGGVGINLTAADTCIIFDSDWNPQNDLQAQARCHRIGQTKNVKVYRLLTRKTYEIQMFHMSSLKMGLDQAVLQGIEHGAGIDQGMSKEEVEKLLRCGAYDIFQEEQEGASEKESKEFIEQDIDSILSRRTKTVIHENTGSNSNVAGGTFSKASFAAKGGNNAPGKDVDIDDPDFWKKMVGESKVQNTDLLIKSDKKRARKKANYNEQHVGSELERQIMQSDDDTDSYLSSASYESDIDDPISRPQSCEFNINTESPRKNKQLQELLELKRMEFFAQDRRRWGGKSATEWSSADVELIIKYLHKHGYDNGGWSLFVNDFSKESSKTYEEKEIKRMCWSITFVTFLETVNADIDDVAKRIEKATQKKEEKSEENLELLLAPSGSKEEKDTKSDEWKQNQSVISFKKFWEANKWLNTSLDDANNFAKESTARNISLLNEDSDGANSTPLLDSFLENIWPSLKNRGWKELTVSDDRSRRSWESDKGKNFKYIDAIIDYLPSVYPELDGTISSVISSVSKKIKTKETETIQDKVILDSSSINIEVLARFLQHYAPLQLLVDRKRNKFISLPRKTLDILTYLRNAHFLVQHVDNFPDALGLSSLEKCFRLSKELNISPRASLPHPSWKPFHDAVLIYAVAKHGWIDKEINCRAITIDTDIKWGKPFGEGDVAFVTEIKPSKRGMDGVDKEDFEKVALRAAEFLKQDGIEGVKGFNYSLVMKTYGIMASSSPDEDGQSEKSWKVDLSVLDMIRDIKNDENDESYIELPTRKDLLKRAKYILSKPFVSKTPTQQEENQPLHQFSLIDQGNILNIFLAELLRGALKHQKTMKIARNVLRLGIREVQCRLESITDVTEKKDFEQLQSHLLLADRHIKGKFTRPVKNILRAVLGLPLVHPVNSDDEMFAVDKKPVAALILSSTSSKNKDQNKSNGKSPFKKANESAIGDLAINRAMTAAKTKTKNGNNDDASSLLGITTIETLILSVVCSQGIPLYVDNWNHTLSCDDEEHLESEFLISWNHIGTVLEVAAEKWVEISKMRYDKMIHDGLDAASLEPELQLRKESHQHAVRLHQKPIDLAKKTIMILEAIRLHMGQDGKQKGKSGIKPEHGLGSRVFLWNKNHLSRWAKALEISINGKTMSTTTISIRPYLTPSAVLDRKNSKAIFAQISQQSRLRSLFAKYIDRELDGMISKAMKSIKRSGDTWEGQPSWWAKKAPSTTLDDFELLSGVLRYGYGGFDLMLTDNDRFLASLHTNNSTDRLYRSSGQQRVNSMTRELSTLDDSIESMRLLNDRKNKKSNQSLENKGAPAHSIQVGIGAFFAPSAANSKTNANVNGDDSDGSDIEIIQVVPGSKRKSEEGKMNVDNLKRIKGEGGLD